MKKIVQSGAYSHVYSRHLEPIERIVNGETIQVFTMDAYGDRLVNEDQNPADFTAPFNPCTGPIYVEEAQKGDTLKIEIIAIEPTRDWAASSVHNVLGSLTGTPVMPLLNEPVKERAWIYQRQPDGSFYHSPKLHFPYEPFIGTIATADWLECISSASPGRMGGNMDVPDVCPGNTLYLPITVDGAYLYVGDLHAVQGDGEVSGAALEMAGKATLRVSVVKGKKITWPRIENEREIMTVGSSRQMEDAARIALHELIVWMCQDYGWDKIDAYHALSMRGKLTVGNMVDTWYSMVAKFEKKYL